MGSINFVTALLVCLCLIGENSGQNNPDNYFKLKNEGETIEYKIRGNVGDFSQLHFSPLGPLSHNLGSDLCYKGAHSLYNGQNYTEGGYTLGSKEEVCETRRLRNYDSVRLLGSASSKVVHLHSEAYVLGTPNSYSADVANLTQPVTNSIIVVGTGVQATFYALPNYTGQAACISVGNGTNIHNLIYNTTQSFGFNTIRSFKFGCNSKKIIHPLESTTL